jgi:hypothetical protein
MINYIVLGQDKEIVTAVLRAIRSFTDARAVVVGDERTSSLRWSTLCDRHFSIDFDRSNDDYLVDLVAHCADRSPYATLIPVDVPALQMVNRTRGKLSLNIAPCPDAASVDVFANPTHFEQFCRRNRVPLLPSISVNMQSGDPFASLAVEFGLPFVLGRPRSASVKRSQPASSVVFDRRDFERATRAGGDSADWVAQPYLVGMDLELCLLADRGQLSSIAIQSTSGTRIGFLHNADLEALARRICRLTAYHGALYLRAKVEQRTGKIFLVDAAPHFWPTLAASVWCGLNFVAEAVRPRPGHTRPMRLRGGEFTTLHPIVQSGAWSSLMADTERGRLLRSMTFDTYSLGSYLGKLPHALWRCVARCSVAHLRMHRKLASIAAEATAEKNSGYIGSHQA